jgi:hypothetical protein
VKGRLCLRWPLDELPILSGADDGIRTRDTHLGNEAVIVHWSSHMFIAMGHTAVILLMTHSGRCCTNANSIRWGQKWAKKSPAASASHSASGGDVHADHI